MKAIYDRDNVVKFRYEEKIIKGAITSVDKYAFEGFSDKITYDIFSKDDNCLYKHINEFDIIEKC